MQSQVLIENVDTILTMDEERRILHGHSILIEGQNIVYIGDGEGCPPLSDQVVRMNGKDKVALPGLINAHAHGLSILTRGGLSPNRRLRDWLVNVNRPGYEVCSIAEMEAGIRAFACECIKSGITTVVEMEGFQGPEHTDALLKMLTGMGLRVVYAPMFNDRPLPPHLDELVDLYRRMSPRSQESETSIFDTEEILGVLTDILNRFHRQDELVTVWPAIRTINEVRENTMRRMLELAEQHGTSLTLHLAESKILESERYGLSATDYLAALGCLDRKMVLAHCVWVNDRDIRLIKNSGARVVHNPAANLYLGSGIAPIHKIITAGIPVGLGLDNPNCNDGVNMWADMRLAALVQKGKNLDASCITAEKVLEMATVEGARVVGLDKIGSLKAGMRADLVLVGTHYLHMQPLHYAPPVLVYQARGHEVDTVMISGRIVMRDGNLEDVIEHEVVRELNSASSTVIKRANITHLIHEKWAFPDTV
jgi:cytosine/adenosine deaminase-related metal-dependent hydrolase